MGVPMTHSGDHYVLDRPVVEVAVFEIRYASGLSGVSIEQGFALRDRLQGATMLDAWRVERSQTQEMMLQLGPGGPVGQQRSSDGVKLSQATTGVEVSVFPTLTSVQVKTYARWSASFRPIIEAALRAVEEVLAPASRERLGLRYVNRFVDDETITPRMWADRLQPSLVGFLVDGPYADHVIGAQHQLELSLDDKTRATLRHGLVPGERPGAPYAYLLDIDVFDISTEIYSADEAVIVAEHLNRSAAELFRRSLGPQLEETLGKHNVAAPGDQEDV